MWSYRDDNIDGQLLLVQNPLYLDCEGIPHGHPASINTHTIDDRVRTGKVYKLEDVWGKRGRSADLSARNARSRNYDSFTYNSESADGYMRDGSFEPGFTSSHPTKPLASATTLSLENNQSYASAPTCLWAMPKGRIPLESRNAIKPNPASIATHANAPLHCSINPPMAVKISSSLIRNFPVFCRLSAKMLRRSSESEDVLMCR